jgi:hypothetical protein
MDADLLSPLLGTMLFPDALQRILPVPVDRFDRVRALEYAFEASWYRACTNQSLEACDAHRLARPISDLYGSTDVPKMFFNVTEVESGRIEPLATARLAEAPPNEDAEVCKGAEVEATGGLVLQDILKRARSHDNGIDPALSTSAVLSARFPYVTPAGRVEIADAKDGKRLCVRRYVDGGYFENSGSWLVNSLVRKMLNEISAAQSVDASSKLATAVLYPLIIRSTPCTRDNAEQPCDEDGNELGRAGWNELMSPVRALANTREARASYSRQALQSDVNQAELSWYRLHCKDVLQTFIDKKAELSEADRNGAPDDQITALREELVQITQQCKVPFPVRLVQLKFINRPGVEIPLSWLLSSRPQSVMDDAIDATLARELDLKTANGPDQRVESRQMPNDAAKGDVKGQFVTIFEALNNRVGDTAKSIEYKPAAD